MESIWSRIKPDLLKMGFKIDDDFLSKISLKDVNYIKKLIYDLPIFIQELSDTMEDSENLIIKKCTSTGEEKKRLQLGTYINKGTYNQVYNIIDMESGSSYVYRMPIYKFTDINALTNNFIETFIHSFLSIYQKKFLLTKKTNLEENWGDNSILKLRHFGFSPKAGLISTITDKMDGTLYDILSIPGMIQPQKINILVKALFQITCLTEHLQEKFKFIHNDLKANNIFYKILDKSKADLYNPTNLHFFVSDFDASRIELEGNVIIGNASLSPNLTFNPKKDLFLLINSLYYSFNTPEWVFSFFGKLGLDPSIIGNIDKFHTLYGYDESHISDFFLPENFKRYLEAEYKTSFDCWRELGLSDDVVITVFGSKYKIKYS